MTTLNYLSIILLLTISASCSKEKNNPNVAITGEWKLITVRSMNGNEDFSNKQVTYYFGKNTFRINSDTELEPWMYQPGEYKYELELTDTDPGDEYSFKARLQIDDFEEECFIAPGKLQIGSTVLDGVSYFFVKQ